MKEKKWPKDVTLKDVAIDQKAAEGGDQMG
jgi:hypothetical protein